MPSRRINITCPVCLRGFRRRADSVKKAEKKSGRWSCKSCSLTAQNKSRARPQGSTRKTAKGYVEVKTTSGWIREHIFVAQNMMGRDLNNSEVVHHINGNKSDNRPENLQVMTNAEHTRIHNAMGRRVLNKPAKLNRTKVIISRALKESGVKTKHIAIIFGVSPTTISHATNFRTWRYI